MATLYEGQIAEIEISMVADDAPFHLGDSTTTFSVEFYVKGKHDEKSVSVTKSEVFFSSDPDTFTAHVPTTGLVGLLVCTITGKYQDKHNTGLMLDFVQSISSNIVVEPKYL